MAITRPTTISKPRRLPKEVRALSYEIFGYMNCCGTTDKGRWSTTFGEERDGVLKNASDDGWL